jgi:predicted permease
MVLLQVALSFILLVGAGLLVQSVHRIRNTNPGFASDGLLTTAINLFAAGYDAPRARNFQDQLMDRIQTMSGVQSATYARIMPFSFITYSSAPVSIDGYQAAADELPTVEYNQVGPTYFMTMGIPLVSGREFTPNDDENAPLVAVVNDVMAAKYWRGEDPVGKRLQVKGRSMRVVGVARLAKYGNLLEKPKPFFYVPLRQNFSALVSLMIRTRLDPGSMATALVREVHALDPELAPYQVIPMREQIDRQAAAQLIAVKLLGVFGGLAVLLAAVGLYGVMSYAVSQSTRELGLRMALGATASNVLRLVMSHGLALSATGVVLGAAVALLCTRLLGYLLYQVSPRDPLAFASAFLVMAVAVLLACFFPAWRATRTNPVRALRE